MARKKIPTTVFITAEQRDALQVVKDCTRKPLAVLHREALDYVIAQHDPMRPSAAEHAEKARGLAEVVMHPKTQRLTSARARLDSLHPSIRAQVDSGRALAELVGRVLDELDGAVAAQHRAMAAASQAREQLRALRDAADAALDALNP